MKQTIHNMGFSKAVLRELLIERDGENTKEISVYLPKWIRGTLELLHIESKMSVAKLYTGMVNHGTSIIEYNYDDEVEALQHVRRMIVRSEDEWNIDFLQTFKPLGKVTFTNPYRRTMTIPDWCNGYLGEFSTTMPIEYSASVRMSIYYSLIEWDEIPPIAKSNCRLEIDTFEKSVGRYVRMCNQLVA